MKSSKTLKSEVKRIRVLLLLCVIASFFTLNEVNDFCVSFVDSYNSTKQELLQESSN